MSDTLSFFIPIAPGVKGNSKRIVRCGARLMLIGRAKDREREQSVVAWARRYAPAAPLVGPLRLDVAFVLEPPRSWSASKRARALAGDIAPAVQPDRGNYLKLVEDALEKAGFYPNDGQIVAGDVVKRYGDRAGYEIRLRAAVPRDTWLPNAARP